jgi:hypothetical protein
MLSTCNPASRNPADIVSMPDVGWDGGNGHRGHARPISWFLAAPRTRLAVTLASGDRAQQEAAALNAASRPQLSASGERRVGVSLTGRLPAGTAGCRRAASCHTDTRRACYIKRRRPVPRQPGRGTRAATLTTSTHALRARAERGSCGQAGLAAGRSGAPAAAGGRAAAAARRQLDRCGRRAGRGRARPRAAPLCAPSDQAYRAPPRSLPSSSAGLPPG